MQNPEEAIAQAKGDIIRELAETMDVQDAIRVADAVERLIGAKVSIAVGMLQATIPFNPICGSAQ